jgi:membrane protease YdiL (CAAX protease family)
VGTGELRLGLLEQALLHLRRGQKADARPLLMQLQRQEDRGLQPLIERLLLSTEVSPGAGSRAPAASASGGHLGEPAASAATPPAPVAGGSELRLPDDPLARRLSCQVLGGSPASCAEPEAEQRAFLQLMGINLVPALALLTGLVLLVREGWLRWRGKQVALPRLLGPDLGLIDVVLLISGGFVLLGEVLTPVLLSPLLSGAVATLGIRPPLAEGITVLGMYLGLMAAPLLILVWLLRGRGEAPPDGWLQFRWRPVGSAVRKAFKYLLMVLPLVSLVGWLQQLVWNDPGGSNPLLELVLRSNNALTLACFAFTALVLAPLFEETIFRGVLLPVVGRELGPLSAVLISSLVFGIAHLSLGEFPALFTLGLGLGWLRLTTGRLSACVGLHALWNGLTFANLLLLAR